MKYTFSNRMSSVKASAVREILKAASDSKMISFGGGNPAKEAFPVEAIESISQQLFKENPINMLQYGITEGYGPLIQVANEFFNRHEMVTHDFDQLIITSGSQQIMEFMTKCLCNEGDVVISENPSFLGALNAFKSCGAKVVGINLEEDGMSLSQLEEALKQYPNTKFIYTIPNFQNPMGISTSLQKRQGIYDLAKKYNVMILEDNPYGDLRFKGQAIPSIKSLDKDGIVVYAASLSKIIAPGMRIAVAIGPKEVINKLIIAKQVSDVHSNVWSQCVMDRFLRTYDMEQHLKHLQTIYKHKANLMLEGIKAHFHSSVRYTIPEGGMFIWVTLPQHVDVMTFIQEALKQNVAVVPGSAFLVDDSVPCQSFRMNFSSSTDENIQKGIKILGQLTYKFCK